MAKRYLCIHQNFPGQYLHLTRHFCKQGDAVVAIGEKKNLGRLTIPNLTSIGYTLPAQKADSPPNVIQAGIQRGHAVHAICQKLRAEGFIPDCILVHPGWGEALFLRDIYPDVPILAFWEFYYSRVGADIGYDPEFPILPQAGKVARLNNALQDMSLPVATHGVAPTVWQHSRYPAYFQERSTVIHDGVDTHFFQPNPKAQVSLGKNRTTINAGDEIITFISRRLEPYRGFHIFMRALPQILAERPNAQVLIIGGEEAGYGPLPTNGMSWRQELEKELTAELKPVRDRIHVSPRVSYAVLRAIMQVSAVHVYLTYPFVLSWSMLEAMACGCLVVGSSTPPVAEVIQHEQNGLLTDFFDVAKLAATVIETLRHPAHYTHLRKAAQETMVQRYDGETICRPAQLQLIAELIHG